MKKTRFLRQMVMMIALCVIMTTFLGLIPVSAATVKMNKAKATMEVDSVLTLALVGAEGSTVWKSSNSAIASVSKKGKVTAIGEGVATITATNRGNKYSCSVNVVDSNKGEKKKVVKFDAVKVANKIKTVADYRYSTRYSKSVFVVAKNNSDYTVQLTGKVTFYDEFGGLIGYESESEHAVGPNEEICFRFSNEDDFSTYKIEWSVKEEKYYSAVCSNVSIDVTALKDKAIIQATNNGTKAAEFVEYYALFFDKGDFVGYDWGYIVDEDSEIKPGNSEMKEVSCYESFDSVKVYISGRGDK